jgi:deoxyadenosine/deoxycytidine kinase
MYLAIEGVIGVGKTTLARLLQPIFDASLVLEVFEENPFLSDFYADRRRYAFQTQIFFLLSRYRHQRQAVPALLADGHVIADYTFAKDSLFASLNLEGDELATYRLLHEALAERIPRPDLVIYLRVGTPVALQRIAKRDRPYERGMDSIYLAELNRAYDSHFAAQTEYPVLSINTDDLDFVNRPQDLAAITDNIRGALGMPPLQPELPLRSGRSVL